MATYVERVLILPDHPSAEEIQAAAIYTGISTVYSGEIPDRCAELVSLDDLPASITETTETGLVTKYLYDEDGVTVIYTYEEEERISHTVSVEVHVDVGV